MPQVIRIPLSMGSSNTYLILYWVVTFQIPLTKENLHSCRYISTRIQDFYQIHPRVKCPWCRNVPQKNLFETQWKQSGSNMSPSGYIDDITLDFKIEIKGRIRRFLPSIETVGEQKHQNAWAVSKKWIGILKGERGLCVIMHVCIGMTHQITDDLPLIFHLPSSFSCPLIWQIVT